MTNQPSNTYNLDPAAQLALMRRLMFGWDEQWFLKAVARYGFEAAAELDRQVRRDFGKAEMAAVLKQLGKSRATDLNDALAIVDLYARTLYGGSGNVRTEMTKHATAKQPGIVETVVTGCQSFEIARKKRTATEPAAERGAIPACEACAVNWAAWFEALLPEDWQIEVERRPPPANAHTRFAILCYPPGVEVAAPVVEKLSGFDFAYPPISSPQPEAAAPAGDNPFPYPPMLGTEPQPAAIVFAPQERRRVVFHEAAEAPKPVVVDGEAVEIQIDEAETKRRDAQLRAKMGVTPTDEVSTPIVEQLPNDIARRPTNFLSRMFFNKEARDLMDRREKQAVVVPLGMADGIERILQDLLSEDPTISDEAHVRESEGGELEFMVGKQTYTTIAAVPVPHIRTKLHEAVRLWEALIK